MSLVPNRRHILIMIPGLAGGTGTFCRSLGSGLRRAYGDEFKVSLLTIRPDAKEPQNASLFDETFILQSELHDDWKRIFDLPRAIWGLRSALQEIHPDLIFTIGTFSNIVASLVADRIPVVHSDHLNMTHRLRGQAFSSITRWFMRRTYRNDLMIVASQELADDLRDNFGAKRTKVIPNGIDAATVRAKAEAPLPALPTGSRYFMWIGRLTQQKDVSTLLRAFAHARQNGLADDLLIAGDGEEREMLESLARELKIADHAHFLGHCPNPYPLIKRSYALVLSSIWEGFAYSPIEAMGLGVPVISTACPSGPVEILGNGEFGILVPPRDPAQLGDAMLKLSKEAALYEHFRIKGHARADQLSVENMARQYRDAFLSELAGRS